MIARDKLRERERRRWANLTPEQKSRKKRKPYSERLNYYSERYAKMTPEQKEARNARDRERRRQPRA